jgi:hypothetical protein
MRELTIKMAIPGEWDVSGDKFSPKHFKNWDKLVKYVSREFDAQTTTNRILQEISDAIEEWDGQ